MFKHFIFTLFILSSITNVNAAGLNFLDSQNNSNELLSSKEAFQPEIILDKDEIKINFNVQPRHYLYYDKIFLTVNDEITEIIKPEGLQKNDPIFGNVLTYDKFTTIKSFINSDSQQLNIKLNYQGCSEKFNICYPPEVLTIKENNIYKEKYDKDNENLNIFNNQTDALAISKYIKEGNVFFVLIAFLGVGILMAFTPCVFPMIPIISSIIVKHDKKHPVLVSSLYVLGMALCYMSIGLILNIFDFNIQIALQNIYLLIATSVIIFILALSMFGFINIRLPNFIQSKIHEGTEKLDKKNNYIYLILSGYLSALMLSPCAVAPLAGTLLFASQYESVIYSSLLLFLLGLGSGIPLVIFSSSFKKLLPKAGHWMYEIKHLIGLTMVLISYYLMAKIIPLNSTDFISILFKTVIFFTVIVYLMKFINLDLKSKISLSLIFSTIIFAIFLNGNTKDIYNVKKDFIKLNKIEDLIIDKKTMVYVGADWCVSCKQMENSTFQEQDVISKLKEFKIYYVDITDMTEDERKILKTFNLQIAPFYVLYDIEGKRLNEVNIGYLNKLKFLEMLKKIN
jgi:thiol:disulfide interchange protein DsbD